MRKLIRINSKGITLIALVITIIVLLILAAISIATLTGENGILTKASAAKLRSEKAEIEEKIKLAVMASRIGENGTEINKKTLESELKNYGFTDEEIEKGEDGKLPWKISHNGFIFQITEDGKVQEVNGISLNSTHLKILSGDSKLLTVTKTGDIEGNITWSTSDATVATVENGKVTAVGTSGAVIITAKIEGTECQATCRVEIVSKVTDINIANITIKNDETKLIEVTTTPAENVEELTYTITTNSDLITIDEENRTITAGTQSGTATVTITATASDGRTFTKEITITIGDQKAKDVLRIDTTATEEAKKSPYVKYNNILCRVLYNNSYDSNAFTESSAGVQIFADDSVRNITLGSSDSKVTASDSTITVKSASSSDRTDINQAGVLSMASYNNVCKTLNGYAKEYLLADGPVSNARCIGCQSWEADPEKNGANWFAAGNNLDKFPAKNSSYKIKKPYELTINRVRDCSAIISLGLQLDRTESWICKRCAYVPGEYLGQFGVASLPTTEAPTEAKLNTFLNISYYNNTSTR